MNLKFDVKRAADILRQAFLVFHNPPRGNAHNSRRGVDALPGILSLHQKRSFAFHSFNIGLQIQLDFLLCSHKYGGRINKRR